MSDVEEQYFVEEVLRHKNGRRGKSSEFLVKWEGYDGEDSWVPLPRFFKDCPEEVQEYLEKNNLEMCRNRSGKQIICPKETPKNLP